MWLFGVIIMLCRVVWCFVLRCYPLLVVVLSLRLCLCGMRCWCGVCVCCVVVVCVVCVVCVCVALHGSMLVDIGVWYVVLVVLICVLLCWCGISLGCVGLCGELRCYVVVYGVP